MKNIFLLALCLLISASAWAAPSAAPASTPAAPPLLEPKEEMNKKLPTASVTKNQAEKYYMDCVNNALSLAGLNPFQRDYLCSCVSAGLPVAINQNEFAAIQTPGTPAGATALNRFMNEVYMPCAAPLIREIRWDDCMKRARTNSQFTKTAPTRCQCYTVGVLRFASELGQAEAEYDIARNKIFSEPFDALTGSVGFSESSHKNYLACFDGLVP